MDVKKIIIAHCIASMDKNSGGTTTAVLDILKEESKYFDLELYTLNSESQIEIPIENLSLYSETCSIFDYSFGINKKLQNSKAQIFHCHALWNMPIHQMASYARKKKIKYIISIHGMLHPWAVQHKNFKKKIALKLYQHSDLKKADCLHATSFYEAQYIKAQGYLNPIAVIPNGINLANYPVRKDVKVGSKRKLLFLSRIHFQKGVEELILAWSGISNETRENWQIEIVGSGEEKYIESLKYKIRSLHLQHQIEIKAPLYGDAKIQTYHSADLFILPTYSENFGMVIAEALSCGVPVITTKGTPWKELEWVNAGSWIDIGVEPLKETLQQYLQKDSAELIEMGRNGRKLIEEKYSIESVGAKFEELYNWILNKAEKPDFVI